MEWVEKGLLAMSGYTTWDRAAYIERVGGELEAERRRTALMVRSRGDHLRMIPKPPTRIASPIRFHDGRRGATMSSWR